MSNVLSKEQQARIALTNARLRVNDFHACSTAEELDRWRSAQSSLIEAAGAVERLAVEALQKAKLAQTCATCRHWSRYRDLPVRETLPLDGMCSRSVSGPNSIQNVTRQSFGCNQWAARDTDRPEGEGQ